MERKFDKYIPFLATAVLYSTMEVVSKPIMGQISADTITALRFLIGSLVIFPFIPKKRTDIKSHLIFAFVGILNIFIAMNALQISVKYIPASMAASLLSSNPLFVYILTHFIDKEKINTIDILSILGGIIGIILLSGKDSSNIEGILWALGASFTFAIYTIISKKLTDKHSIRTMTSFSFLYGGLFTLIIGLFRGTITTDINILKGVFPHLLYLGIGVTGLGYLFFFLTIKKNSSRWGSYIFLVKPIFATIFAIIFLKEILTGLQYTGTLILLISLYFLIIYKH